MKLSDIYYGYWSASREWSWNGRVLVSLFVAAVLVYIALKLTYRLWRPVLSWLEIILVRIFFLSASRLYFDIKLKTADGTSHGRMCERYNCFTDRVESFENRIRRVEAGRRGYRFRWLLVIYAVLAVSVAGPVFFEADARRPWNLALSLYREVEKKGLAKAEDLRLQKESEKRKSGGAKETEDSREQTVRYCLNDEGRNGSNLRKEPGKKGEVESVLEGDVVMEQLEAQEYKGTLWVHVKLEDGREGWISRKLIQEIEE